MDGMTCPDHIPASPSAGFPIYGLDVPWPGAQRLDSFGDAIGEEVRWVRLAHQSLETGAVVASNAARAGTYSCIDSLIASSSIAWASTRGRSSAPSS